MRITPSGLRFVDESSDGFVDRPVDTADSGSDDGVVGGTLPWFMALDASLRDAEAAMDALSVAARLGGASWCCARVLLP